MLEKARIRIRIGENFSPTEETQAGRGACLVRRRGGRRERDGRPELGPVGRCPALGEERGKPNTTGTDEEIGQKHISSPLPRGGVSDVFGPVSGNHGDIPNRPKMTNKT